MSNFTILWENWDFSVKLSLELSNLNFPPIAALILNLN